MRLRQAPHRFGWSVSALGLCALTAGAMADETGCLLHSLDALPDLAQSSRPQAERPLWKLLQSEDVTAETRVAFACSGDRLSHLNLQIAAGESRSLVLVAETGFSMALVHRAETSADLKPGNWTVTLQPFVMTDDGSLQARDDAQIEDRINQLLRITVVAAETLRSDERHELVLFKSAATGEASALRLTLESGRDERMFRDNFQHIDPTLGQFSQRRSSRQPGPDSSGPAGAGL